MKGLALFRKTNSKRHWNIASFHSPHSLTWSWILSFSLGGESTRRLWPIFMPSRTNDGLQLVIRIPFIGMINWHRQRPMWFRDMYQRLRDDRDELTWRPRPQPATSIVNVLDGGNSVH